MPTTPAVVPIRVIAHGTGVAFSLLLFHTLANGHPRRRRRYARARPSMASAKIIEPLLNNERLRYCAW